MTAPTEEHPCIDPGCRQPADRERPLGVTKDGDLIVELVCHEHEQTP